jgi:rod shape-determining protein MreD
MVRKVRLALCVAVLFLLQAALVPRFSYGVLRPDLLVLVAAFLALEADYRGALWSVFAIGLLRDLGSIGRLGGSGLLLVPACAGLVLLREHLVRESFLTDLVLAGLFVLAFSVGEAALSDLFVSGAGLRVLLTQALGQAAFTAALAPLLFAAFEGVGIVDRSSAPGLA